MKYVKIKSLIVSFCQNQYDLTEILNDYIQIYGQQIYIKCFDPENVVLEDMIDSVVHVIITDKHAQQIAFGRAKMRLFTPELSSTEFGLQPHVVFEFKEPLIIDEDD